MSSREGIAKLRDWRALRALDLLVEGAKALQKRLGPFVGRLEDHLATDPSHQDLRRPLWKAAFSRQPYGLAAAVLKELGASCCSHRESIDSRSDIDNAPLKRGAARPT